VGTAEVDDDIEWWWLPHADDKVDVLRQAARLQNGDIPNVIMPETE